jgi:hypothetical protein
MIENKEEKKPSCHFVLLSTEACHLCDDAAEIVKDLHEQMLARLVALNYTRPSEALFSLELVDIVEDDALIETYGKRIPVLIFPANGEELAWPFDIQQAYQFIYPKLTAQ